MWIPIAYMRHAHHAEAPKTIEEMRASRAYMEAGLIDKADLDEVVMTIVHRSPHHETRCCP